MAHRIRTAWVWAPLVAVSLTWLACNSGTPPGSPDAGTPTPDAGLPDAGKPDASQPDAGGPDAGPPDASVPDASVADAGDAGPTACANEPAITPIPDSAPELALTGAPDGSVFGITDPSVVYPDGGSFGVMAYSSVQLPVDAVVTQVAVSNDNGASWAYASQANDLSPVTVTTSDRSVCDAGTCSGMLVHEVPTILIDPYEPDAGARFKLYVHSYFDEGNGKHFYAYGYLGLQTAGSPVGPWSPEEKVLGWNSSSTLSSTGVNENLSNLPALSDCIAFSEPGVMLREDGAIDLSIGCSYYQSGWHIRIVLLRSSDRGHTFQYVGRLLSAEDARCLGDSQPTFNGSDLFTAHGQEYLMASTEGPIAYPDGGNGHQACWVFPVTDPDAGTVLRDDAGGPIAVQVLQSEIGRRTGACTYAEGAGGYLVPMGFYDSPPRIERIFQPAVSGP